MSCRKRSTTCVKSASSCTAWDTWHLISRCLKHRVICHLTRSWHGWPHPCLRPPQSCQSMWSPATFQCINNFNHSHFATQYQCPIHIHRPHNSKINYCRKTIDHSYLKRTKIWTLKTTDLLTLSQAYHCNLRCTPPPNSGHHQSFIFRGSM